MGRDKELEEGEDEQEENLGGAVVVENPMDEMVEGTMVIEVAIPLPIEGATLVEREVGTTAEAMMTEARVANAVVEEGEVVETGEIRPQILYFETLGDKRNRNLGGGTIR